MSVLHKGLLLQDWVFRLGAIRAVHHATHTIFLPIPARKESNVPHLKSSYELTVLIFILCSVPSLGTLRKDHEFSLWGGLLSKPG